MIFYCRISLIFLLLFKVISNCSADALEWGASSINLQLDASSKGLGQFTVHATPKMGYAEIKITSVTPSCGCTVVDYPDGNLVGQSEVSVVGRVALNNGEDSKRVTIEIESAYKKSSGEPGRSKTEIKVNVARVRYIELSRGVLLWKANDSTPQEFEVKNINPLVASVDIQLGKLPITLETNGKVTEGSIKYALSRTGDGLDSGGHYHVPVVAILKSGDRVMYGFHILMR